MRICFITYNPDPHSGWGRYADDIIAGARKAGHKIDVAFVHGRGPGLVWATLRTITASRTADIVYAIDGWPFGVLAWLATRLWRNKLIIGAIGTYTIAPLNQAWTKRWVSRAYRDADAVVAISRYTREQLLKRVPQAKITVITPGIDIHQWRCEEDGVREQAILSVGAVKSRKGFHVTLEAFALARKSMPELQWWIIGSLADTRYVESLRRRAEELDVANAIHWYENIPDERLHELYCRASLFMLLSENRGDHFEGFGIVFLEAAAAGLPVIGTTGNGIEDAVGPENGILVLQQDVLAAAKAIQHIIIDRDRWDGLHRASRVWAQHHTLETMYTELEKVYASVAK